MLKKFFRSFRQGTQVLALVSLAVLAACQTDTVNTVEASIDSAALTALTSQKVLLRHPCTETVTTLCPINGINSDGKIFFKGEATEGQKDEAQSVMINNITSVEAE